MIKNHIEEKHKDKLSEYSIKNNDDGDDDSDNEEYNTERKSKKVKLKFSKK